MMCGVVTPCLVYEHENAVMVFVSLSDMQPEQFCLFVSYNSAPSEKGSDGYIDCTHAL